MGKFASRSVKLGLLVAGGLILFALAIFYLGSQQDLFSSTVVVKSYFKDVKGLMEGNKVQYSGITVGHVAHIEIIDDTTILVQISVDRDVQKFIRTDSKVDIGSDGLMGSKILNIYPGSAVAQSISDDDVLLAQESIDFEEVLEEALSVFKDSRKIASNMLEISNKMNNGDGDFALLVNERNFTSKLDRVGNELLAFSTTANDIIGKIKQGEGDLGKLIGDSVITSEIHELMINMDSVVQKSDVLVRELNQYSNQLNNGNGLLTRIAYDTVMADNIDTTIVKISNSVDDVERAAETIDRSWIFNLFSKKRNKSK
ncbi:MAG: MlaD family protein [Mariniphaga sp.]|jgi:phospholipid/cholesterol/gamma-HCH transport system substrate-binding protein|nr:MlaD family protein [Mariniphaga sp.]